MPLRKQKVSVVISQGVQTKIDHKVLPTENLTLLENGEFSKIGRIEKRKGYAKLAKATSGLINYRDDLISRNVSRDSDDDGTEATVYSESAATFQGNKGWSSGLDYSPLTVSRGSSLFQKEAQAAVSIDGKYALVTFLCFDLYRENYSTDELKATITKRCSLVDRETGTVMVSDMKVGTSTNNDGTCRMRPIWVNDKFYIVGEEGGGVNLWSIDPSESTVQLRDGTGATTVTGTNLYLADYPLTIGALYPHAGLDATFDIAPSNNSSNINIVRVKKTGSNYYLDYDCIILGAGVTLFNNMTISLGGTNAPNRSLALHRTQLGGIGPKVFVAYGNINTSKTEVIGFAEYENNPSNVVSIGDFTGGNKDDNKHIFVDNPQTETGTQDIDYYLGNLNSGGNLAIGTYYCPSIRANAGSLVKRGLSGNGISVLGFPHESNETRNKGPSTIGFFQHRPSAAGELLSPVVLGTSDLNTSVFSDGAYYTGKQYPRERDYLTTNSFEPDYQGDAAKSSEPDWEILVGAATEVKVPGKVVALPMATNFNNHYGESIVNSVTKLYDFRPIDYSTRCKPSSVMLNDTLYVADNALYSYDNNRFYIHGILNRPWVDTTPVATGGSHGAGRYYYKTTYEWEDGLGNLHQSEPSGASEATTGSGGSVHVEFPAYLLSSEYVASDIHDGPSEIYRDMKISSYRTRVNGTLYNRNSTLNAFGKKINLRVNKSYLDKQSDTTNSVGRFLYSDSGELANTPPPSPSIYVAAHKGRLFTIGKDKSIYFSKLAVSGFGLGFNPSLKVKTPDALSDPPTALGSMDGVLYIFTEKSIFYLLGEGPDNLGNGQFYEPKRLPSPVGAAYLSPVKLIDGGLLFTCAQGIFLIDRNQAITEIGAPVEDLLGSNKVLDIKVDTERQIAYFQTSSAAAELITYNYGMKQWGRDVLQGETDRIDSIEINQDRLVISTGTNLYFSDSSYTDDSAYVPLRLKTAWVKLDSLQGYQRAYNFQILGEATNPHKLTVKVRYDYDDSMTPELYEFTSTAAGKLQFKGHLSRQKCQSIQFEIADEDASSSDQSGYSISQIELEIGYKPDQYKNGLMKISGQNTVGSS